MIPTEGGWRVAETATHHIDVLAMLVNFRVVEVPKADPFSYGRFWCYAGRDEQTFLTAVAAAVAWAASGEDEPRSWNKNGVTGEWRAPAATSPTQPTT